MGLSSSPYAVTSPQIGIKSLLKVALRFCKVALSFLGGNKNFFVVCPKKAHHIASFALEMLEKRLRTVSFVRIMRANHYDIIKNI